MLLCFWIYKSLARLRVFFGVWSDSALVFSLRRPGSRSLSLRLFMTGPGLFVMVVGVVCGRVCLVVDRALGVCAGATPGSFVFVLVFAWVPLSRAGFSWSTEEGRGAN